PTSDSPSPGPSASATSAHAMTTSSSQMMTEAGPSSKPSNKPSSPSTRRGRPRRPLRPLRKARRATKPPTEHPVTDTAPEIAYITNIWTDVARDDRRTRNMLTLLRNGHPGSRPPAADDAPPYGDPTGEWAITNDGAARLQDMY